VSGSLVAPHLIVPPSSGRPRELGDDLVANDPSRDGGLVPAQPVVEVPFLELLADAVGRNVLRPRRLPDLP